MTPVRLARLLDGMGPPAGVAAVRRRRPSLDPGRRFTAAARGVRPDDVARRYADAGAAVLLPGAPGYPGALVGTRGLRRSCARTGDTSVLEARPAVAVVGTRSATPYGAKVASELGRGLAAAGVVVVSGLARGIDAAAHAGALAADRAPLRPSPSSAPGSTWSTRRRTGPSGARWRPAVPCCRKRRSVPTPCPGCSRRETASSPPCPTSSWWSRASGVVGRCTPPRPRHAGHPGVRRPRLRLQPGVVGHQRTARRRVLPVRDADDVLAAVSLARQGRGMSAPMVATAGAPTGPVAPDRLDRVQRSVGRPSRTRPRAPRPCCCAPTCRSGR